MASFTFTNYTGMTISAGDPSVQRQSLMVYGISDPVTGVDVQLDDLAHTSSDNIDMLLVAPDGTSNLEFWSAAGNAGVSGDFVISDSGANSLALSAPIAAGTYRPADYTPTETDTDFGTSTGGINHAAPEGVSNFASSFGNIDGNGAWTFALSDALSGEGGSLGSWGLTIETGTLSTTLAGTGGDDLIQILSLEPGGGVYSMNDLGTVRYSGLDVIVVVAGEGNDTVYGSQGIERIYAGDGVDDIHAGDGGDDIYFDLSRDDAGELYDGGAKFDYLVFDYNGNFDIDLRDDTVISIEAIQINNPGTGHSASVRLNAAQFGGTGISTTGLLVGDNFSDTTSFIEISMVAKPSLDLSGMLVGGFDGATHFLRYLGGNAPETVIGTTARDVFNLGAGDDTMTGGNGDDTYYVDSANDRVFEADGTDGGTDRIFASRSYTLGADVAVETMTTISKAATTLIDLSGNDLAQTIAGNDGINILKGFGGADSLSGNGGNDRIDGGLGIDTMAGGTGNDSFFVDDALDRVIEASGAANGVDTVYAARSYALASTTAIEQLVTTLKTGTDAINLTGNNFAQSIGGNDGDNLLLGLGGDDVIGGNGGRDRLYGGFGNDRLVGGTGNDLFLFNTLANASSNHDVISDFSNLSGNNDTIYLDDAAFAALATGGLGGAFAANATGTATQADDRIIYNTATGDLFYDANGSTSGGSVLFATLSGHPAIGVGDFVVY